MTAQRGFSLIELAIVLVIVTILIGGLAVPLSAQIQARRIAETRQIMTEARETILGYAMTHPTTAGNRYLPCPDTDGDGHEDRKSAPPQDCVQSYGWLPWVTLGAPHDAWGNRLRYAVISPFSDKDTGFSASSPSPPLVNPLGICTTNTCVTPDVASNVVIVLVSHGANGWGARNINGNTLAPPVGLDEKDNLNTNQTYISRAPSKPDATNGEFDDLTMWVSRDLLTARVCPTGYCTP